jgi:hypothetical protein
LVEQTGFAQLQSGSVGDLLKRWSEAASPHGRGPRCARPTQSSTVTLSHISAIFRWTS